MGSSGSVEGLGFLGVEQRDPAQLAMIPDISSTPSLEPRLPVSPFPNGCRPVADTLRWCFASFESHSKKCIMMYTYFPILRVVVVLNIAFLRGLHRVDKKKTKVLVNVFEIVDIKSYLHESRLVFWILIFMYTYIYIFKTKTIRLDVYSLCTCSIRFDIFRASSKFI